MIYNGPAFNTRNGLNGNIDYIRIGCSTTLSAIVVDIETVDIETLEQGLCVARRCDGCDSHSLTSTAKQSAARQAW